MKIKLHKTNKNVVFKAFFIFFVTLFLFIPQNCKKVQTKIFEEIERSIFFSDPNGYGIRMLSTSTGNISSLTNGNDDYPYYVSSTKTLFFVRTFQRIGKDSKKSIRTINIFKKNLDTDKETKISQLTMYIPRRDKKDNLYFVDNGHKLIISPLRKKCITIDTNTGSALPNVNPCEYFNEINQYNLEDNGVFGKVKTELSDLYFPDSYNFIEKKNFESLFYWKSGSPIRFIEENVGGEIYNNWYYGLTYSNFSNELFYSKNNYLYKSDMAISQLITEGVHPFSVQTENLQLQKNNFPFFQLFSITPLSENNDVTADYIFTENNHMAVYHDDNFHIFENNDFIGGKTDKNDPTHIFDHLVYFGKVSKPKGAFILASTSLKDDITPDTIASSSDKPDIVKIFNLDPSENDGTIDHTFFYINDLYDMHLTFRNLDQDTDKLPNIILHYTASNYTGFERMQASGRAIQWIDIYKFDAGKNTFQQDNYSYGFVYKELLENLNSIYEFALNAKRSNLPIMSVKDLEILKDKIDLARSIVYRFYGE
ncbi:MAG: hypothetical protein KAH01_03440 [Caldisericia bacterium]|nr:hypothetical protein [Caldisericia bacterium]